MEFPEKHSCTLSSRSPREGQYLSPPSSSNDKWGHKEDLKSWVLYAVWKKISIFPHVFLCSYVKLTCAHCSTEVYMKANLLIELRNAHYGWRKLDGENGSRQVIPERLQMERKNVRLASGFEEQES